MNDGGKRAELDRLAADLKYVELLEQGGLEAVNSRVAALFEDLTAEGITTELMQQKTAELNDLFYRAIYLFPFLATGIVIRVNCSRLLTMKSLSEDFSFSQLGRRGELEPLMEGACEGENESRTRLFFPLPYEFTTGTHGSGQRGAVASSKPTLRVSFLGRRIDAQAKVPVLHAMTWKATDESFFILFPSELAEPPRFVDESGPTQSTLMHYLAFRGFYHQQIGKSDLWIPDIRRAANLWMFQPTVRSIFAVVRPDGSEEMNLVGDGSGAGQLTDEMSIARHFLTVYEDWKKGGGAKRSGCCWRRKNNPDAGRDSGGEAGVLGGCDYEQHKRFGAEGAAAN